MHLVIHAYQKYGIFFPVPVHRLAVKQMSSRQIPFMFLWRSRRAVVDEIARSCLRLNFVLIWSHHDTQIRLSSWAVLVKYNLRFRYFVASFSPSDFSETYFGAPFSRNTKSLQTWPPCWKASNSQDDRGAAHVNLFYNQKVPIKPGKHVGG